MTLHQECCSRSHVFELLAVQALPIFLDRLADPITAVLLSITVVLIFGKAQSTCSLHLDFLWRPSLG